MNTILEQINSAGYVFVEFALPMLVQSSLLIVVLLLADLLLRKKVRAVFRYWLWMLVLLKLILPTTLSSPVSLGSWFGDELATVKFSESTSAEPVSSPQMAQALPAEEVSRQPAGAKPVVAGAAGSPMISPTPVTWQGIVFLVWAAVVAAMGLLLLQRAIFVNGLGAQAKKPTELMNDTFRFCCGQMGLKGKVGLKVSANTASPAVCGLFRPVILLPQNLAPALGSSRLRPVLLHELAHISRGDLWVNLAQTILQIIYFYNPLLWLANSVIRRIREQAVDEAVQVAMGANARQYPQTLVDVAKLAFNRPVLSLRLIGVVESKSALKGRIKRMLNRPIPKTAKLGILGLAVILIIGCVLLPMAKAVNQSADAGTKEWMQNLVEDFFKHNYRDITARKTIEWGDPVSHENGNMSIRYKYEATIWGKDKVIQNKIFTFDKEGKFVSVKKIRTNPTGSKAWLQELVEDFFKNNYRDITSRRTLEWGDPFRKKNSNYSIRYKYEATIWNKEKIIQNKVFTFDEKGNFVSVKDVDSSAVQVEGLAPMVLRTTPVAFTDDVSPELQEITVTFDQPMMDRSWSWTGGGDTYPETTGRPRYDSSRTTCSLPVKLEPGKVYWVGINSPSYKNFKNPDRVPAKRYVILFATKGTDGRATPIPSDMLAKARRINAHAEIPLVDGPPMVVSTTPAAFANDVSPELNKITVTFDQPMMDEAWSWVQWDAPYPKTVGSPYYDNEKRTCTLPVKLKSGKAYLVAFNLEPYTGFVNIAGEPAKPYVLVFATKGKDGKPTPIPEELITKAKSINERAEIPYTQIMYGDIQPDGTILFKTTIKKVNRTGRNVSRTSFINSKFVEVTGMSDSAGRVLKFTVRDEGEHWGYDVVFNEPVLPGEVMEYTSEGTMEGLVKPVPGSKDTFQYSMTHWPQAGQPTRRIETYLLPEGAELIYTTPEDMRRRTKEGRIELHVEKMIPTDGSITTAFQYRLTGVEGIGGKELEKIVEQAVMTISTCAERDPQVKQSLESLQGLDEQAVVKEVVKFLDSDKNTVRRSAIYILWKGNIESIEPAAPHLQNLCSHEEEYTRGMAALALGARKVEPSFDTLCNMTLNDSSAYARRCAAYALGLMGNPEAKDVLEKALKDSDFNVSNNAEAALTMLSQIEKQPIQ